MSERSFFYVGLLYILIVRILPWVIIGSGIVWWLINHVKIV